MISSREKRTALYRFYDSGMGLLYVGVTDDPRRRWSQHIREKPWFSQAKHWTVTWYESELAARRAETRAIKGERPRFNIAGAPETIPVLFTVRPTTVTILGLLLIAVPYAAVFIGIAEPPWKSWLSAVGLPFLLAAPVVLLTIMLVNSPNAVRRFGVWLDTSKPKPSRPSCLSLCRPKNPEDCGPALTLKYTPAVGAHRGHRPSSGTTSHSIVIPRL